MVVPHAAVAHATKRQVVLGGVQDAVIDRDPARHDMRDQVFDIGLAVAKRVERQRARARVDRINGLLHCGVADDGQHRAKNFPRAQGKCGCD